VIAKLCTVTNIFRYHYVSILLDDEVVTIAISHSEYKSIMQRSNKMNLFRAKLSFKNKLLFLLKILRS